ncbi:hypothetical protein BaRGS_00002343 [Batillaria attramentaria]|uniref:Uncharacterized protein n=1 Tax=Batillaria attramentaria TaxID=370345 RepID=A0ABD0M3A7_9CAEN
MPSYRMLPTTQEAILQYTEAYVFSVGSNSQLWSKARTVIHCYAHLQLGLMKLLISSRVAKSDLCVYMSVLKTVHFEVIMLNDDMIYVTSGWFLCQWLLVICILCLYRKSEAHEY